MSVTYVKLVERLVDTLESDERRFNLPELTAEQLITLLKLTINVVIDALAEGEDVALEGFGRFYPEIKPPKKVHSGITRKNYALGYRVIIKFNAFTKLAERVRQLVQWIPPNNTLNICTEADHDPKGKPSTARTS